MNGGYKTIDEILKEGTAKLNGQAKEFNIKDIWKQIIITEEPPEEIPLIKINGVATATAGNHSLIVGKKKSRKTLFLVWLLSQYSGDLSADVLFFDTEQGQRHVYQIRKKVFQLTGKLIPVFYLRGRSPQERQQIILETVKQWPSRPKIILIDGIRDLMNNINDPVESTELITWIEALTTSYGLHVINVLHLNKTDNNPRGHIGTELANKAEMTIELELDKQAGCSKVTCTDARDKPFEDFYFTHGQDDLPELVNTPIKGNVLTDDQQRDRLRFVFEDGELMFGAAVENIKSHFSVGRDKAAKLLAGFNRQGWVVKFPVDGKPYKVYKLMI